MQSIHFTTPGGENVFFDNSGDSPARYELINLQSVNKGKIEVETIGYYDASLPKGQRFSMNNVQVVWKEGKNKVGLSSFISKYTKMFLFELQLNNYKYYNVCVLVLVYFAGACVFV